MKELQSELQDEFQEKLDPDHRAGRARRRACTCVFSIADSGVVWADPGLDLTAEVIKRLDAAAGRRGAGQEVAHRVRVRGSGFSRQGSTWLNLDPRIRRT